MWRCRRLADEPFGVGGVGGGEHVRPGGLDGLGAAGVDVGGGVQAQPGMAVFLVIPGEKTWQCARAASIEAKRRGKSGRYFRVLNWLSE